MSGYIYISVLLLIPCNFVWTAEKRVCPGTDVDTYESGTFMTVTLSCDHRVIDGFSQPLTLSFCWIVECDT